MDRGALDAGTTPSPHVVLERLDLRRGLGSPTTLRERLGEDLVCGQRPGRIQPAPLLGLAPHGRGFAATHQPGAGDLTVGLAQTHAHEDVTVFMHLEPPIGHGDVPPVLRVRGGRGYRRVRPVNEGPRPVIDSRWRLYADPEVAPLCRSRRGSIMPVTPWLHYAGHAVAPYPRSPTSSRLHPPAFQDPTSKPSERRACLIATFPEKTSNGDPRGPFEIVPIKGIPENPVLWSHDAARERGLVVRPDSEGEVRPGCGRPGCRGVGCHRMD